MVRFLNLDLVFLEVAVFLKIVPSSRPVRTGEQGKTGQGLALTTCNFSRTLPASPPNAPNSSTTLYLSDPNAVG